VALLVWEGGGRRRRLHDDRSSAALMEATAKSCTRARGPGRPFIGKRSEEGEARRAGLRFKVATGG
jgi:hypothetical protein